MDDNTKVEELRTDEVDGVSGGSFLGAATGFIICGAAGAVSGGGVFGFAAGAIGGAVIGDQLTGGGRPAPQTRE